MTIDLIVADRRARVWSSRYRGVRLDGSTSSEPSPGRIGKPGPRQSQKLPTPALQFGFTAEETER